MKSVVYTSIVGGYDALRTPRPTWPETEYVAFLDPGAPSSPPWQARPLPRVLATTRRTSRFAKIMAHTTLPGAEYSLWMDGNIIASPHTTMELLIAKYLSDADLAVLRHPCRTCLYEEATECSLLRLDDPHRIADQVRRYRSAGFPAGAGLGESGVILRRHTREVAAFNEAWWAEIERGSVRDQISFPYVAREMQVSYMPGIRGEGSDFILARAHGPL